MKNTHKFLIQALLWLIAFNPILLAWQPLQFARFKQSTAHQTKLDLQIQPIFYTSKIPHSQQKLYEQMILTHAQHQDFQHTKTQEPRFILNLKNKEQQKTLAQNWQQELVQSEQQNDQVKTFRLTRRLYAIAQTIPANNNGLNSELESCLLYEFKESYLAAKQLEQMHPEEISIKTILPLITDCAEAARQEPSIEQAFAYSDLAHNVVTICSGAAKFIGKIGTAVGKGIAKGALQSAHNLYQLTKPGHWIALAQQFKHFSVAAAHAYVKAEEFSELMFPITDKNYDQRFKSCMAQHRADSATMNTRMKETWKKLKETPWEELTETGVALGASLILDFVTLNAVSAIASTAKTKIIEEIATIFKQEETLEKAYLIEVAGIGKMQLEGEALLNANKLKNIHQKEAELISKKKPKQSCQPKESNVQFDFDDGDFVHPSTPVYTREQWKGEVEILKKRKPTIIYGRKYSGHAIQRIQERGLTPIAIEHTITHGLKVLTNRPKSLGFYDPFNQIFVTINEKSEQVITVITKSKEKMLKEKLICKIQLDQMIKKYSD